MNVLLSPLAYPGVTKRGVGAEKEALRSQKGVKEH
jgi:hypothetical protein